MACGSLINPTTTLNNTHLSNSLRYLSMWHRWKCSKRLFQWSRIRIPYLKLFVLYIIFIILAIFYFDPFKTRSNSFEISFEYSFGEKTRFCRSSFKTERSTLNLKMPSEGRSSLGGTISQVIFVKIIVWPRENSSSPGFFPNFTRITRLSIRLRPSIRRPCFKAFKEKSDSLELRKKDIEFN